MNYLVHPNNGYYNSTTLDFCFWDHCIKCDRCVEDCSGQCGARCSDYCYGRCYRQIEYRKPVSK